MPNSRFFIFIFAALFLNFSAHAQDVNPNDQKYEDRLGRIFKNFQKPEITDQEWADIAGEKITEKYSLSQGDTLWDVSEKFFGSGFYWPKVWQLNDRITNPHFVYKGGTLQFSSGTMVSPPSLTVAKSESADVPTLDDSAFMDEEDGEDTEELNMPSQEKPEEIVKGEIVIPKGKRSRKILTTIPPSFPEWKAQKGSFDKNGFAIDQALSGNIPPAPLSIVSTIVTQGHWDSVGQVSEMEGELKNAATHQKVFIKLRGVGAPGDVFTVFGMGKEVIDPDTHKTLGKILHIKGLVKILETEGAQGVFSAEVIKSKGQVTVGDHIVSGDRMVKAVFEDSGQQSQVGAKVLAVKDNEEQIDSEAYIFGLHQVIYLDRGVRDGLTLGAVLPVFKNYQVRNSKSQIKTDSTVIAKVKIVNVEDEVATAVVVKGVDPILPGDETGVIPESVQNRSFPDPTEPDAQF